MNLSRQQMLALGISGALVYVSMSVIKKGGPLRTALLAVGAVGVAKNAPVVGDLYGRYL